MGSKNQGIKQVDQYIDRFKGDVKSRLETIRALIRELAPEAVEKMGYGVPAFDLNGPLVYYAAFNRHVGLYPTEDGITAFQDKLSGYSTAKGTVKFPLDQPLPMNLIREIVAYRIQQNRKKSEGNA